MCYPTKTVERQYQSMKASNGSTPNKRQQFGYEKTAANIPITVSKEQGTGGALRTA